MAIAVTSALTSATSVVAPAANQPGAKDDAFAAMLGTATDDGGGAADDTVAPCTDNKSALQGDTLAALTNALNGGASGDASGDAAPAGDMPVRGSDGRSGKWRKDARDDIAAGDPSQQIVAHQPLNTQPIAPTPAREETAVPADDGKTRALAIRDRIAPDGTAPRLVAPPMQTQPVQPGPAQPAQAAAANDDAATPDENVAETAAAMLADGAAAKPAAPADVKPGVQKTEAKSTTAAKLADAGKPRAFTANKLSAPDDAATTKPATASAAAGDRPQQQAPAADAGTVKPTAQPASQPAPSAQPVAAPVANAQPTQTAMPSVPLQVHVHAAPVTEQPDIGALAVNIAAKAEGGTKHFDIRLDPAELGRVDVRLSVDDAGKAQALLTVEKPQTLELLQKDSTHLERALKDAGLDLTQSGLSFSLKGQQQQAGNNNAGTGGGRGRSVAMRAIAAVDQAASNINSTYGLNGSDARLDIRV